MRMQKKYEPAIRRMHTLIIGSGAAGLAAAVQLHRRGVTDLLILTEGLAQGTSINTGSDKQTYYKLSLCGEGGDSPRQMAQNLFEGGSMHGDLALAEAANSAAAFLNLIGLGVKFPQDKYGQFVGYKTDHDPRQRATSVGPYTSRDMCRCLIEEVRRRKIEIREKRVVASLATLKEGSTTRIVGAVALNARGELEQYAAENVVFATGGFGGLYKTSVYPAVHTGGIGLAMRIGAECQSLPEAQYGLASTKFRWNVSGTYMQVIPAFVSTDINGDNACEFLRPYFVTAGEMNSRVFLKGYQWPFDPRKVADGSSLVDLLVYIETVIKGRRVWLDFRRNPEGYAFAEMSTEAREYLQKSSADKLGSPLGRLQKMNPGAITLYRDHKIDLAKEPLEIAVCAQHNNGGLAADHWWQSLNISRLFPIGEVNGSHGVYRPGGSALNSGQVGALRAAEFIAYGPASKPLPKAAAAKALRDSAREITKRITAAKVSERTWREERTELQARMSRYAAHIREAAALRQGVKEAKTQWKRIATQGGGSFTDVTGQGQSLRNHYLCFAQLIYLQTILAQVDSGTGSRGSALVLRPDGQPIHPQLGAEWRYQIENESFRQQVLQTTINPVSGSVRNRWVPCRQLPDSDEWFETAWATFHTPMFFR